jgi:hypothetical protein
MKKVFLILISFLFVCFFSYSQDTKEGVINKFCFTGNVGSLIIPKVKVDDLNIDLRSKVQISFNASFNIYYKFLKDFKLGSGIGYDQRKYNYSVYRFNEKLFEHTISYYYFSVPLSIIYNKPFSKTNFKGFAEIGICRNFFNSYLSKSNPIGAGESFIVNFGYKNYFTEQLVFGVSYKIAKNWSLPIGVSIIYNNYCTIATTQESDLHTIPWVYSFKTGINFK